MNFSNTPIKHYIQKKWKKKIIKFEHFQLKSESWSFTLKLYGGKISDELKVYWSDKGRAFTH